MVSMDLIIIILRFGITFLLSLIYGIERQYSHKPIGFGTFTFVAIGSCALALIAVTIAQQNPLPLLAGVVTGIGFIGAGALLNKTDKVVGFTTAAGIWVFSIFGLVVGVGDYTTALVLYSIVWIITVVDRFLEKKGIGPYQRRMIIHTNRIMSIKQILDIGHIPKHKIIEVEVDKKNQKMKIEILVEGKKEEVSKVPEQLMQKEWFDAVTIE